MSLVQHLASISQSVVFLKYTLEDRCAHKIPYVSFKAIIYIVILTYANEDIRVETHTNKRKL